MLSKAADVDPFEDPCPIENNDEGVEEKRPRDDGEYLPELEEPITGEDTGEELLEPVGISSGISNTKASLNCSPVLDNVPLPV